MRLLRQIRRVCGTLENLDDWERYINLAREVLLEYGENLPEGVRQRLEPAFQIDDTTKQGLQAAC